MRWLFTESVCHTHFPTADFYQKIYFVSKLEVHVFMEMDFLNSTAFKILVRPFSM